MEKKEVTLITDQHAQLETVSEYETAEVVHENVMLAPDTWQ